MWIVTGKTASGKEASYKVPASKDTDKGHIVGLAYAEHSKDHATDPLDYPSIETQWTADNVQRIPAFQISQRSNFSVEKRVSKGVWERHSVRALRNDESAIEALEGAASADPEGRYRVVETRETKYVVAVSKNAKDLIAEEPDKPVQEEIKIDAPTAATAPTPGPTTKQVAKKATPAPKAA